MKDDGRAEIAMNLDFLRNPDPLGTFLRCHDQLETLIEEVLITYLPFPERIRSLDRQPFEQKARLCGALGLTFDLAAILAVNSIRNRLAHHPDLPITVEDVQSVINAFPPDERAKMVKVATCADPLGTDFGGRLTPEMLNLFLLMTCLRRQLQDMIGYQKIIRPRVREFEIRQLDAVANPKPTTLPNNSA